jgi:hypothetical protein
MDRQGNSLDRALLLARLLEIAGHPVRLAHGQLTEEEAAAVLRRSSQWRRSPRAP